MSAGGIGCEANELGRESRGAAGPHADETVDTSEAGIISPGTAANAHLWPLISAPASLVARKRKRTRK